MAWHHIESARNPLNADLGEGIRKHGFRKWYERELLSGHAHMVLCLLATLGLMGSLEAFSQATWGEKLADAAFVVMCVAIGVWSLRRYLFLLTRAEYIANQANCPRCQAYGRLQVASGPTETGQPVRCKACGHEWQIEIR